MIFLSVRHTDWAESGRRNKNAFQSRRAAAPAFRNGGHDLFIMTQYRKLYADYYGITWDAKEMEVHHVDYDRSNNHISNLILLPRWVHRDLHKMYSKVRYIQAFVPSTDQLLKELAREALLVGASYVGDTAKDYYLVLANCSHWCLLRNVRYYTPDGRHIKHITPETELFG